MKPLSFSYKNEQSLIDFIITKDLKECSYIHVVSNVNDHQAITSILDRFCTGKIDLIVHHSQESLLSFYTDISLDESTQASNTSILYSKTLNNLKEENRELKEKIAMFHKSCDDKDQIIYQQSRLASMGEMISNIAHQWRQPLNIIALVIQDIYISNQLNKLTSDKVDESYEKANKLIQYMSQTIDDFRSFFEQDNDNISFSVRECIDSVYDLISPHLEYSDIDCDIQLIHDSVIEAGENGFKQVVINLLNNAREAILSHHEIDHTITIRIDQVDTMAHIEIYDDGGGIDEDIIDKVFDPYFTTKPKTQGTGLGLYMSKQIIENTMLGVLEVDNYLKGARFTIKLPLKR